MGQIFTEWREQLIFYEMYRCLGVGEGISNTEKRGSSQLLEGGKIAAYKAQLSPGSLTIVI